VIRAPGRGYGYGYGYGRSDPQGMPLTGNAPWGTPGHAANRHCPLGPAPAPATSPPSVEWKEPSGSAESACVTKLVGIRRMLPPLRGPIKL
jgi:hypothetical protein